jgi:hypothetical protein
MALIAGNAGLSVRAHCTNAGHGMVASSRLLHPRSASRNSRIVFESKCAASSISGTHGTFGRGAAVIATAPLLRSGVRRIGRGAGLRVCASWGAPVEFSPAKVVSNHKAAEQLHRIIIDVGDLAAAYTTGGQYMQIKARIAGESIALRSAF